MDGEQNGAQAQQQDSQQKEQQASQQQTSQQEAQSKHAKETGADADRQLKQWRDNADLNDEE